MLKRTNVMTWAGVLIITILMSGCSGSVKSLEEAYTFPADRGVLYEVTDESVRAKAFASDLCVATEQPYADEGITSGAAAVFDLNNATMICNKNVYERMNPASTTKIVTLLVAVKSGVDLDEEVTVTEDARITEAGATLCGILPGDVIKMRDLLYGLMIPSGNDAGAAIAVHLGGSIEGFSKMMNDEAKLLGATGTHFVNPHGLTHPDHYTTAYDLYLIYNEGLKYDLFREVTEATTYTANYKKGKGGAEEKTWNSTNRYVTGDRSMPEGLMMLGGKTGTTNAAGYCLIMASAHEPEQKENPRTEYISVVLKAGSRPELYDNMTNIVRKIDK